MVWGIDTKNRRYIAIMELREHTKTLHEDTTRKPWLSSSSRLMGGWYQICGFRFPQTIFTLSDDLHSAVVANLIFVFYFPFVFFPFSHLDQGFSQINLPAVDSRQDHSKGALDNDADTRRFRVRGLRNRFLATNLGLYNWTFIIWSSSRLNSYTLLARACVWGARLGRDDLGTGIF
ncbi:hypothetical protein GGR50DRAFT_135011 [Xylaria sp. CBS 124048]|nr:hypothetical protein GGR50DRAFT_135011 [Xylaria sp. CBS 124048]